MKVPSFFLYAMTFVSVVKSSTDGQVDTADMVPFYLKRDESNPNGIIAVVYYGELGDASKEIEVPCTMNSQSRDKYTGPESISCHCLTLRRLRFGCSGGYHHNVSSTFENTRCELQVPFHVIRDANGTIVDVKFDKDYTNSTDDSVLVVPFYPKEDKDGKIVAVTVSNDQDASSPSMLSPLSIACIAVGSILVVLVGWFIFKKRSAVMHKDAKVVAIGSKKNITNSATPAPVVKSADRPDDDTMTEASNSFSDRN